MKAILWLILALSVIPTTPTPAHAEKDVGNGGDAVFCENNSTSPFSGYYSLDYLLTYKQDSQNQDVVAVSSWEQSRDKILSQLSSKSPELAKSFRSFLEFFENREDVSEARYWDEAPFGLIFLNDQKIGRKLPSNCYKQGTTADQVQVIQSVIRTQLPTGTIRYEYDPAIYRELKTKSPLQFSFLMIHEWLWDVTGDVDVIRQVNRYLHSKALEDGSPEIVERSLRALGLYPVLTLRSGWYMPMINNGCAASVTVQPESNLLHIHFQITEDCRFLTKASDDVPIEYMDFGCKSTVPGLPPSQCQLLPCQESSGLGCDDFLEIDSDHSFKIRILGNYQI